jgi:hypothetical protein
MRPLTSLLRALSLLAAIEALVRASGDGAFAAGHHHAAY